MIAEPPYYDHPEKIGEHSQELMIFTAKFISDSSIFVRRQIQVVVAQLAATFSDDQLKQFLNEFSRAEENAQNFCYGVLLQLKTRGEIELCSKCCQILCSRNKENLNLADFIVQGTENSTKMVQIWVDVKYIKNDVSFINATFVSGNMIK